MTSDRTIAEIYQWYLKDWIKVDRAYQRKLVWTLSEKQYLIDTIMHGYPLPMFMVIGDAPSETKQPINIMDGLQRLEAIISFINNKYPIWYEGQNRYFNLDCVSGLSQRIKNGEIIQKTPTLSFDDSSDILSYTLPLSFIKANSIIVENVFKRINSTGKLLSPQSLRQSGVTSLFSRIVQEVASSIRNDLTDDQIVTLQEVENISLSSPGLDYGVNTSELFWISNDIINDDAIRRSKDEEIISNILNCLISGETVGMTRSTLNNIYDESSEIHKVLEEHLAETDCQDYYINLLLRVFKVFQKCSDISNKPLAALWCDNPAVLNKDCVFIVLFLAIARLFRDSYEIANYDKLVDTIHRVADRDMYELITGSKRWNRELREELISRIIPKLQKCMLYKHYDPSTNIKVLNILKTATLETQLFDFKIGVTSFNKPEPGDMKKVVHKCIETLIAMSNSNPKEDCYIIFGVADKKSAAEKYATTYSTNWYQCNNVYITGVNGEANSRYKDVDSFARMIRDAICESKDFPDGVLNTILSRMNFLSYNELTLITFSLSTDKPIIYNDILPIRTGNSNKLLNTVTEISEYLSEFYLKSSESNKTSYFN